MAASELFVGHVGACESGKTYRLKCRVAAAVRAGFCRDGARFLVADVKREWPRSTQDPPRTPLTYGSKIGLGKLSKGRVPLRTAELPNVTICRPRSGASAEEVKAWFDRLCGFALDRKRVVLVAPEVYRYAREHERMSPRLEELAHEHRHAYVGLWFDCQSFPEVSKELLRRAGWLFVHGTGAHEDLERLKRMGGVQLRESVLAAMRLNDDGAGGGRRGHYVLFRPTRPVPPYTLFDPEGRPLRRYLDHPNPGAFEWCDAQARAQARNAQERPGTR